MYSKQQPSWKIKIDDISDWFLCNARVEAKDAVYKREEGLIWRRKPEQRSLYKRKKKNRLFTYV